MVSDLSGKFWTEREIEPHTTNVKAFTPSSLRKALDVEGSKVLVATFSSLNQLRNSNESLYLELAEEIDLIVVDEGHYEPAVEWGKSVKLLDTPTVLLTATPYRNDLKLFRITDPQNSTHHFTHAAATRNGIIRELDFLRLKSRSTIPGMAEEFAQIWTKTKAQLPSKRPRAIICCATAQHIEEVVATLQKAGIQAIGIHDQFKNRKEPFHRYVPNPRTESSEVWVHQHKLTEGLDDNRFSMLALFTKLGSDRKLVQQIGRILRKTKTDRDAPAIVCSVDDLDVSENWKLYCEFETNLEMLNPQHFRSVVEGVLNSQPSVEYFTGRFRGRFDPSNLVNEPQVLIPSSVKVRRCSTSMSLDEYIEDCTDTLNTEDAVILGPDLNAPCIRDENFALWVYATVRNSRLLSATSLYEVTLETHCVVTQDGFLLVADTSGIYPLEFLEKKTTTLSPSELACFIEESYRPTNVSLDSALPYETVIRGSEIRGSNLLGIPTSLTDRLQICRSARANSPQNDRRYAGLLTGRLREDSQGRHGPGLDLRDFVAWVGGTAKLLKDQRVSSRLFDRYLPTCSPPPNPAPTTLSIDLLRPDDDISLISSSGSACSIESLSSAVEKSDKPGSFLCRFTVKIDQEETSDFELKIEYQESKQRFWFSKKRGVPLSVDYEEDKKRQSFAEFLNKRQDLVLMGIDGGEVVYQGRNFYQVDYDHAERELIGRIVQPRIAKKSYSEKGTKEQIQDAKNNNDSDFPENSLFRLIDEGKIKLPFSSDFLICDDLGTECADFVAGSFEKKELALIHVKVGSNQEISASAFHDVVAQAMKNLTYVSRISEPPKNIRTWHTANYWNNTKVARARKLPANCPTRTNLWKAIQSDIVQTASPKLHVVLVTSGCCNKKKISDAINDKGARTPETAQLIHLLDGLGNYAAQLGVKITIVDVPRSAH